MSSVFISYVAEDSPIAKRIASGLESQGFSTWYYERDSLPAIPYLLQTKNAIQAAQAFVLVLSENSLNTPKQIDVEVVCAHESGLFFMPILVGISWLEFEKRQELWKHACGAAVGSTWLPEDPDQLLGRMATALNQLGVTTDQEPAAEPKAAKDVQPAVLGISRDQDSFRFRITLQEGAVSEFLSMPIPRAEQAQLISMVEQATLVSGGSYSLEALGSLMYSMLFPSEIQTFLQNLNTPLLIDTSVPEIPWELFYDPENRQFLSLKIPLGRCQSGQSSVILKKPEFKHIENRFLVIGSEEHASLVGRINRHGYKVDRFISNKVDADEVVAKLLKYSYLGIHYAGDAAFDQRTQQYHLILAGGTSISSDKLVKILQMTPFIFLNACEPIGPSGSNTNCANRWKMTEYLVSRFLQTNACCVIATRWKVADSVACDFAAHFYEGALLGKSLGDALREARIAIRQAHPKVPDWAAFILYGDPTICLASASIKPQEKEPIQEPTQLTTEVPDKLLGAELFLRDDHLDLAMFSPSVASVLPNLVNIAVELGHSKFGTPHLFIMLARIVGGRTQQLLKEKGIDSEVLSNLLGLALKSEEPPDIIPELTYHFFSERGLHTLDSAKQAALRDQASQINESHVLAGILSHQGGPTTAILIEMGLNLSELRAALSGDVIDPIQPLNLARDAQEVLLLALKESYQAGYASIETPFYVIGLLSFPGGCFFRAIQDQNIAVDQIVAMLRELMPRIGEPFIGPGIVTRDRFSQRLQGIVSRAEAEALASERQAVTEADLVHGLIRSSGSLTLEILRMMSIDLEAVSSFVRQAEKDQLTPNEINADILLPDDQAMEALNIAYQKSVVNGFVKVETPFLWIGLLSLPEGSAQSTLSKLNIDPATVLKILESAITQQTSAPLPQPLNKNSDFASVLSVRLHTVLSLASDSANRSGCRQLSERDLFIGLLKAPPGQTNQLLNAYGIDPERVLHAVMTLHDD